jgi:hypothetical protein
MTDGAAAALAHWSATHVHSHIKLIAARAPAWQKDRQGCDSVE